MNFVLNLIYAGLIIAKASGAAALSTASWFLLVGWLPAVWLTIIIFIGILAGIAACLDSK